MAYFNFHKCFCGSRNSAPPVPTPITAAQFAAATFFWDIVHHNKFCRELISLLELSIKSGNERWDFIKFAKNYRKKRNRRKRNTKHMALDGSARTYDSYSYSTLHLNCRHSNFWLLLSSLVAHWLWREMICPCWDGAVQKETKWLWVDVFIIFPLELLT